jgi:uncharacterized membrane protein YraQ (UPF0718 family)
MVFMLASTNLVIELGLVLWILIGWQFALREYVGGIIMIGLLAVLARFLFRPVPRRLRDRQVCRVLVDVSYSGSSGRSSTRVVA